VYAGTPWWGSILIAALTIRVVTIPLTIRASDQTARLQAIAPVLKDLQTNKPPPTADMAEQQKFAMQQWAAMSKVKSAAGVGFGGTLLNAAVQGILGFGMFRLMSGLATTPGIGLTSEGVGWFTDLTVADPYYVLPAVMGASMFGMFWVSQTHCKIPCHQETNP
jgi:YidC/Oxa1 family membrane protein insertase